MFVNYEESYDFINSRGYGISSITRPENHTVVFVMIKIQDKLAILENYEDCFVFYQKGIEIPQSLGDKHIFCEVEDASVSFAEYVQKAYGEKEKNDRTRRYTLTTQGYTLGENVIIGDNSYIEPGVFIDHDVVIGSNCTIKHGAILKYCVLEDDCIIGERAFIGNTPYTYHTGETCLERTIAVGKVFLSRKVDVGAYSIIDRGSITNTKIGFGTKVDANVYVGHDVVVGSNCEITSGSLIGGFSEIGDDTKVYTANIMKRTNVQGGVIVGFNSGVISDIKQGVEVFGYPARMLRPINK